MAINAINIQPLIPAQPIQVNPAVETENTVQVAPIQREKMQRVMHKLIKIMAELQKHLLDVNKEISDEKSRATKEMMQSYKDSARMLHRQAFVVGIVGGGSLGSGIIYIQNPTIAGLINSIAPMGKEAAQKPFEGWQRTYEGSQRKFEQLSNELGQTVQSTTAVLDGISDKLQGAMRNAAPAA